MRHRKHRSKLNRTSSHRKALVKNLGYALIQQERIHTTHSKAKQLAPFVERLLTLAKRGDLAARRLAFAALQKKTAVHKLFEVLAPRFSEKKSGFTRIVKDGYRSGDSAPMAFIELTIREEKEEKAQKKK